MAAAHCAATLRRRGADGSILLVGREPHVPYERPPLSKEYLRGESQESDAYVNGADWYGENDVELLTETSVMSLDAGERTAKLQTREQVRFGKALIGTGARVNILHHLEGARLEGIHYLRTLGNSDAIREEAKEAGHVVLIGGSYIGSEVAASLTTLGVQCTMVMLEEVVLSRTFGTEPGRYFHEILESHGIQIVGGEELDSFVGDDAAVKEYARRIAHAAEMGVSSLTRLRQFIRQEPHNEASEELVDLAQAVDEVIALAAPLWDGRPAHAWVAIDRELASGAVIRGLPGEVRAAVLNLVHNALDAMPAVVKRRCGTTALTAARSSRENFWNAGIVTCMASHSGSQSMSMPSYPRSTAFAIIAWMKPARGPSWIAWLK
jgi:hypothetical protein